MNMIKEEMYYVVVLLLMKICQFLSSYQVVHRNLARCSGSEIGKTSSSLSLLYPTVKYLTLDVLAASVNFKAELRRVIVDLLPGLAK